MYFRMLHHAFAYAPVDFDGQVDIVVDIPLEVYEPVRLVVHLAGCLYVKIWRWTPTCPSCVNT